MKSIKLPNVEIMVNEDGHHAGQIDEIFVCLDNGKCVFHIERMSGQHFWAEASSPDYKLNIAMDFSTCRVDGGAVEIYAETRTDEPEEDDSDPETGEPKRAD